MFTIRAFAQDKSTPNTIVPLALAPHRVIFSTESSSFQADTAACFPPPLLEFFRNRQWLQLFCLALYQEGYIKGPTRKKAEGKSLCKDWEASLGRWYIYIPLSGPSCHVRKPLHLLFSFFSSTCYIFHWSQSQFLSSI